VPLFAAHTLGSSSDKEMRISYQTPNVAPARVARHLAAWNAFSAALRSNPSATISALGTSAVCLLLVTLVRYFPFEFITDLALQGLAMHRAFAS
jgi:hypothetical protein